MYLMKPFLNNKYLSKTSADHKLATGTNELELSDLDENIMEK